MTLPLFGGSPLGPARHRRGWPSVAAAAAGEAEVLGAPSLTPLAPVMAIGVVGVQLLLCHLVHANIAQAGAGHGVVVLWRENGPVDGARRTIDRRALMVECCSCETLLLAPYFGDVGHVVGVKPFDSCIATDQAMAQQCPTAHRRDPIKPKPTDSCCT